MSFIEVMKDIIRKNGKGNVLHRGDEGHYKEERQGNVLHKGDEGQT
ncbi:hypothetical protein ACNSTQ_20695 [Alkalihalobacterium sp. APHAB7]